jgi:hypothetical protein
MLRTLCVLSFLLPLGLVEAAGKPDRSDQCQRCRPGQRRCTGRAAYRVCRIHPRDSRCRTWVGRRCPAGHGCRAGHCVAPPPPPPTQPQPPTSRPATPRTCKGPPVAIEGRRILLCEKIYLLRWPTRIHPRSLPILGKLARFLAARPQLKKVRIEAHTDARGLSAYNRRISQERADLLRAHLVSLGVDAKRLQAVGVGEDRPLDTRTSPEAWARNRRIELHIP